jgi:hypothetical protein
MVGANAAAETASAQRAAVLSISEGLSGVLFVPVRFWGASSKVETWVMGLLNVVDDLTPSEESLARRGSLPSAKLLVQRGGAQTRRWIRT